MQEIKITKLTAHSLVNILENIASRAINITESESLSVYKSSVNTLIEVLKELK